MSRKRYISTEISTDKKVAELADHGLLPLLLFTWAIPHMDDWGRITGDAREFKLLVCPGLDVTTKDVDEAIDAIVSAGLWLRYEVDGKKCIAVANQESWFKHQSYINKEKRNNDAGSHFPSPPQNAEKHRKTPQITEEQQETPQNAEECRTSPQNPVSPSPSLSPSLYTTATIYSGGDENETGEETLDQVHLKVFGTLFMPPLMQQFIRDVKAEGYSDEFIRELMYETGEAGHKPSLRLMKSIYERWKRDGVKSRSEARRGKVIRAKHWTGSAGDDFDYNALSL